MPTCFNKKINSKVLNNQDPPNISIDHLTHDMYQGVCVRARTGMRLQVCGGNANALPRPIIIEINRRSVPNSCVP